MDLQIELAPRHKSGLLLRNPVLTAAGTFGYGIEYGKLPEVQRLGAVVTQGTTLYSRTARRQPRMVETASGLLYASTFPNPGVRSLIERYAPVWEDWETPVIVNIVGEVLEDLVAIVEQLEGVAGVAGIEVSLAGLDSRNAGLGFGLTSDLVTKVTTALRRATTLPLIIKLPPDSGDLPVLALAAAEAGIDAISLIGAFAGLRIDVQARRPALSTEMGGLVGPAIRPLALRQVWDVACELRASRFAYVPVIGCGGIVSAEDALEFLLAGASAIQIGTINFVNPHAGVEVLEGIEAFCRQEGITSLAEIIGAAL